MTIDLRTGKKIVAAQKSKFAVSDWLPVGKTIPSASPSDYDLKGRVLLPPIYRDWFESSQNFRRGELALDLSAENTIGLRIDRPRSGSIILLDPEIPGNSSELKLVTNLPEFVIWSCDTLEIDTTTAKLKEGVHTLIATDSRDGSEHRITITVKKL